MDLSRRDFLKTSLGATAAFTLDFNCLNADPFRRPGEDNILVVLQLTGGNDGLNTVVPYNEEIYIKNRPTLHLKANQVLKIDSHQGFHPNMKAIFKLFKEGHLNFVQNVGYENSSDNHEAAMTSWQTADPVNPNQQTGWLGRTMDCLCNKHRISPIGVLVGNIQKPLTLNAERTVVPTIRSLKDLVLKKPAAAQGSIRRGDPLLELVSQASQKAVSDSRRIERILKENNPYKYPPFQLAQKFDLIAQMIRANLGVRIFYTDLGGDGFGGFDNHASQGENHGALLRQLSESLAAFIHDLKRDNTADRVLVMTFSEFGRTVQENGRRGTGHGAGAPMFFAGGPVKTGAIGHRPDLKNLVNGGIKPQHDFRRIYATILDSWLRADSHKVLGGKYAPIPFMNGI